MTQLPTGTVTFLFTDIEGSTALLKRLGRDRYEHALAEHAEILRSVFADCGGQIVDTQGDSFFVAFPAARDAIEAAVAGQHALGAHDWPDRATVNPASEIAASSRIPTRPSSLIHSPPMRRNCNGPSVVLRSFQ